MRQEESLPLIFYGFWRQKCKAPTVNQGCTQIGHEPGWCCEYLRYLFAYTVLVWNLPQSRLCDYTVRCKGCGEIVTECPLCGQRRAYLPPDIFRGRLSFRLFRKPVKSETKVR
jgi:hypothetical protein